MFKRTCTLVAIIATTFGIAGAAATQASANAPIDPAGVYVTGGAYPGCTETFTDGPLGITTGTVSDTCFGTGIYVIAGKTISVTFSGLEFPGPFVAGGTLGKHGIGSAAKPGTIADGTFSVSWWATR
jgi:hypothetical protein